MGAGVLTSTPEGAEGAETRMGWRCEAVRKGPRLIGLFCVAAGCAFAHDIPNDVTAQMYVRPAGQQLQVLMRHDSKEGVYLPRRRRDTEENAEKGLRI